MPKAKSAVVQITPDPITIPKHKPWGWIFSIIILIIVLGAGFWFWRSKQTITVSNFDECKAANGQIQETFPERCVYQDKSYINEAQQLVDDSTLSGEAEAPYATYSNEKLGFALVIPESWKSYTVTESLDTKTGIASVALNMPTRDEAYIKANHSAVSVIYISAIPLLEAEKMEKLCQTKPETFWGECLFSTSGTAQNTIIGKNAKFVFAYTRVDKSTDYPKDFTQKLFDQADKIVSTFKIIEAVATPANTTLSTKDWKVFSKFGFELKYPDGSVKTSDDGKRDYTVITTTADSGASKIEISVYEYKLGRKISGTCKTFVSNAATKDLGNSRIGYLGNSPAGGTMIPTFCVQTKNADYTVIASGAGENVAILETFKFLK